MKFFRWIMVAAAALSPACDANPTSPVTGPAASAAMTEAAPAVSTMGEGVERRVYEGVWDLSDVYWGFECEGSESELIDMEGGVRHRLVMLEDAAGGFHAAFQAQSVNLYGVGVDSGEEYRARELEHESWNDQMERGGTYTTRITLEGRDSGRGFLYTARGSFHVNANGEVVVETFDESFTCTI